MPSICDYNFQAILEGAFSYLPGSNRLFRRGTSGSDSARYCYSVWLRHLIKTHAHRHSPLDGMVVELGPGDSLGTGLASLLSGACRFIAIDIVRHAKAEENLKVFEELVSLFADRTPIPSSEEFPGIKPHLDDHQFPSSILHADWMRRNLDPRRLQSIADSLQNSVRSDPLVEYVEPACALTAITAGSVDIVFSQAVLEHVDDLIGVYQACFTWLKQEGLMSHQIDFKSHGLSHEWNGHWAYAEPLWRLTRGKRPYLLNREPCSIHLQLMEKTGFEVLAEERTALPSRLQRKELASRFRGMTECDLTTAGVYVVARKVRHQAAVDHR